jgi:peptidoglycan/LPS O-acetylase OafA/YrhL
MSRRTRTAIFQHAPGLDGVRALAVLAVVAYHLGTTGDPHALPGGYLGVDIFFVLSGYLITSLLIVEGWQTGRISIRKFYERRARRLLPALGALLLTVAVLGTFWLTDQAAKLRGEFVAALTYLTNWWLVVEKSSYFGGGARPSPLTHLWSLAVEEQFYVVWPLAMILLARFRVARRVVLALLALGIVASSVTGALLYDPYGDPSRVYYGTDTRALAPLMGAALAFAVRPWWHRFSVRPAVRWSLDATGWGALAGLGALAILLHDNNPLLYRGGFPVIALLAAALVGVAGHPATLLGRWLGRQPLRWLGERSYALYLWHWPVCVLTRPGVDVPVTGWANAVARVLLSVGLAELSYRFVETPFRRARPFVAPRVKVRRAVIAGTAAVVVAGLGLSVSAAVAAPAPRAPVGPGPAVHLGALPSASARPAGPPSVAVFGDSQGMTLLLNKPEDLGTYINVSDATIEGCGVLLGKVASRSGERRDLDESCGDWNARWAASAKKLKPQIALVMIGAWEVFDLTTDTGTLTFGSADWDAHLRGELAKGITVLKASGATVALSLLPCYRPVQGSAGYWPERGDDERTRHVNEVLKSVAAADSAHVHTIEPPAQFCTDPSIAGNLDYRWDGVHYYKPGAALYFQAVVPQLLKLP